MSDIDVVKKFFVALVKPDQKAVAACLHPDAIVWHNYDNIESSLLAAITNICRIVPLFESFEYVDGKYEAVAEGVIVRHTLRVKIPSGEMLQVPIMLYVTMKNAIIVRSDEYIDANSVVPMVEFITGHAQSSQT